MKFDATDSKLLEILQEDCKLTNKEIAEKLNLSVTATYERIRKLEREGVISKYVALIDRSKIDKAFTVFCYIKLTKHYKDQVLVFENDILSLPEVIECYHVSGEYDYILKILVKDLLAYRKLMVNELTKLPFVEATNSIFVISETKFTTAVEL